jgi:hypothetical protein
VRRRGVAKRRIVEVVDGLSRKEEDGRIDGYLTDGDKQQIVVTAQ